MTGGMADLLAAHQWGRRGCACGWGQSGHAEHVAAVLTAAGYGDTRALTGDEIDLRKVVVACEQYLALWGDEHAESQMFGAPIQALRDALLTKDPDVYDRAELIAMLNQRLNDRDTAQDRLRALLADLRALADRSGVFVKGENLRALMTRHTPEEQ